MTLVEQRAEAILRRVEPGMCIAEVGVFYGQLSEKLLAAGLYVYMIDNWLSGEAQSDRYRATGDYHGTLSMEKVSYAEDAARQVWRKFPAFKNENDSEGHPIPNKCYGTFIKGNSVNAARLLDDKSFDMVFLDADHSYDGVKEDIHEWMPKVKPGGWLGGHDYGEPSPGVNVGMKFGVTEAVNEMIASWYDIETDLNMTWFVRL